MGWIDGGGMDVGAWVGGLDGWYVVFPQAVYVESCAHHYHPYNSSNQRATELEARADFATLVLYISNNHLRIICGGETPLA